ncbi:MAG TPA: 4-(cytidine 5'-diphospho)-2-C-methyl-D-erythritol kinase [Pseudaminobacter sp.]|nr:4-(cytidine 5'-diphospho)-2-C-methyl-D-erythritol kinase [Pseudaminobacter sp.]
MDLSAASLAEHAPAKINLALHVTGRRPDGFHLIESLAVFTRHGDRVTVAAAPEDSFFASGPFGAEIPLDGGNLVMRARDALRSLANLHSVRQPQPVSIHLTKHLPIASGIGGGSSDAAATLTALNRLCSFGLTSEQLTEIGQQLGADVPMCLCSSPLIARGIGEQIEPAAGFPALAMVLVNPGVAVSTPEVFRALASWENAGLPPLPLVKRGQLAFGDICRWLATTRNDLQAPAVSIAPAISHAIEALTSAGAGFARMSGSGATCFGLFETASEAARAAAQIQARQPGWWVVATESIASKDDAHAPA